jgi:hypothetical protein
MRQRRRMRPARHFFSTLQPACGRQARSRARVMPQKLRRNCGEAKSVTPRRKAPKRRQETKGVAFCVSSRLGAFSERGRAAAKGQAAKRRNSVAQGASPGFAVPTPRLRHPSPASGRGDGGEGLWQPQGFRPGLYYFSPSGLTNRRAGTRFWRIVVHLLSFGNDCRCSAASPRHVDSS